MATLVYWKHRSGRGEHSREEREMLGQGKFWPLAPRQSRVGSWSLLPWGPFLWCSQRDCFQGSLPRACGRTQEEGITHRYAEARSGTDLPKYERGSLGACSTQSWGGGGGGGARAGKALPGKVGESERVGLRWRPNISRQTLAQEPTP